MKVLAIYDTSGPKFHRILLPCYLMPEVEIVVSNAINETVLEGVDVVFVNRAANHMLFNLMELKAKFGFKLIVDLDDHWRLDPTHILYHEYKERQISEVIEEYIKVADCVTVTHERLLNEVLPFNSNVHILPNSIPSFGQFIQAKEPSDKIRLFWAGSATHKNDVALLKNPSKRINSDKVKWVLGGYHRNNKEMQAIASYYTNGGMFDNEILEVLPVHDYYKMYSKCDIALIPLVDNSFNRFKSNLKILEAANMGCPVVVSKVNPYLDFPEDLVNYVEGQGDWYKQVKKLIDDPSLLKTQGERLKQYCYETFNFNEINLKRKKIFDETIQQGNTISDKTPESIGELVKK